MARYDSFMLRVWRSSTESGEQWSGRIEHLQQGTRCDVSSPEELFEQLRQIVAAPRSDPSQGDALSGPVHDERPSEEQATPGDRLTTAEDACELNRDQVEELRHLE